MRESYASEKDSGFKCLNPDLRSVVIIGGNGQLGGLFGRMFKLSGYQVKVLGSKDWDHADEILDNAGLVVVTVPIHLTEGVIEKLGNLPQDCILCDLTSIKSKPLQAMLNVHQGPVLVCTQCLAQMFRALPSRLLCTVMVVVTSITNGYCNSLEFGAQACAKSMHKSTIMA